MPKRQRRLRQKEGKRQTIYRPPIHAEDQAFGKGRLRLTILRIAPSNQEHAEMRTAVALVNQAQRFISRAILRSEFVASR